MNKNFVIKLLRWVVTPGSGFGGATVQFKPAHPACLSHWVRFLAVGAFLAALGLTTGAAKGATCDVTFSVDMSASILNRTFNPATMGVEVTGDFTEWGSGRVMTRVGTSSVYTVTFPLEAGEFYYYKYQTTAPDATVLERISKRFLSIHWSLDPLVLPTGNFNNLRPPVMIDVTFSVDMEMPIGKGDFDPATMGMEVHGDFHDGPQPGLVLARVGTSSVYRGTVTMGMIPGVGRYIQYRFCATGGGLGCESIPDRTSHVYTWTDTFDLPTVYFNDYLPPVPIDVTFSVDLAAQIYEGTFDPATMGVEVHGDFHEVPQPGLVLARAGAGSIYRGTVTIAVDSANGERFRYRFCVTGGGLGCETVADREFPLEPNDPPIELSTYCFNDQIPPVMINATFSVDMAKQMHVGAFDPATMGMEVHGDFRERQPELVLARAGTGSIYTGTVAIAVGPDAGRDIPYRFCATGGGLGCETIPDRTLRLEPNDPPIVHPTVYFNDDPLMATVAVTFSVDLAAQTFEGTFDPTTMIVDVWGSFNRWDGGEALARAAPTSSVYSGTLVISSNQGATIDYKFIVRGGPGMETIGTRSFALGPDGVPQVLPTVYFNNQLPPVPVDITLSVDMSYEIEAGYFDPAKETARVIGSFTGWSGGSNLVRQGTSAIYSGTFTVLVDANEGTLIQYKFESYAIVESIPSHTRRLLPADHPLIVPTAYFNNQPPLPKVPVQFSVNMSAQMALGNFNPSTMGVEVDVYNHYNGTPRWAGALAREGGSDMYSGTFIVPGNSDATRNYRFRITRTNDVVEESFYRLYDLGPAGATQTLPVVYFDNVGPEVTVDVTFAVDMGVQIAAGAFNPATMGVEVRGGFNTWASGATLARVGSSPIYAGTFAVTGWRGGAQEYLFNCTGVVGLGLEWINNRSFTLGPAGTTQVLPTVLFNDQKPPPSRDVRFSINMSVQIAAGVFNPGTMSVAVGGDFNGWSSGMVLSRAGTTSNYSGTFSVSGIEGWEQGYRFRILDGISIIEETVPQFPRFFDLDSPGSTQDMPIVFFNNQSQPFSVAHVTFSVDMRAQMMSGAFNPATMGVEVFGTFNSWNRGRVLTRAGTNSIYSGTFAVPGIEGAEVQFLYLFSGNPDVVELAFQPARSFELGSAGTTQVLSTVYFDNQSIPDPTPPGITASRMVTGQLVFDIPAGHALQSVYGADTALVNGAWVWTLLQPSVHYTVNNGSVTIISQDRKVIRIGLVQN